jgi:hypothetical protein
MTSSDTTSPDGCTLHDAEYDRHTLNQRTLAFGSGDGPLVHRSSEDMADDDLRTIVEFEFVGGGKGSMTKEEIIFHIVTHTTDHRGVVGDMLKQAPYNWLVNDLHDHYRPA